MKNFKSLMAEIYETMTSTGGGVAGMHQNVTPLDDPEQIAGREPDRIKVSSKKKKKCTETFAGCPVFNVTSEDYNKCLQGRKHYERWSRKMNMEDINNQSIRTYAHRNPGRPVIIKDSTTGIMSYLIPRNTVNEGVMGAVLRGMSLSGKGKKVSEEPAWKSDQTSPLVITGQGTSQRKIYPKNIKPKSKPKSKPEPAWKSDQTSPLVITGQGTSQRKIYPNDLRGRFRRSIK
jgi:hypothetical protein